MKLTNQTTLEQRPSILDMVHMDFAVCVGQPVIDSLVKAELSQDLETPRLIRVDGLHKAKIRGTDAVDLSVC